MNIVIAILSPGAMGSAISVRLVGHGARVLTSLDGRSAATVDRARAAGMEDVSPETIATADLILSIVPPGEAVALAKGLARRLSESRHKPVYIDCNALSPKTKTEIAGTLAETGCDIIDGAIVGAPPQPGEKGPRIYVSGDRSGRASVLRTLGFDLRQYRCSDRSRCCSEDVVRGYQQRHYCNRDRDAPGCFPVRCFHRIISGAG